MAHFGPATGDYRFDPGPLGAGATHLHPRPQAPQLLLYALQARVYLTNAGKYVAKVRGIALGDEGRNAQRKRRDLRQALDELDHLGYVFVALGGQADHLVELEALEAQLASQLRRAEKVFFGYLLLEQVAQALAGAVGGHGKGAQSAGLENLRQFTVHPVGADAGNRETDPPLQQRVAHLLDEGVVGERRPHQPHLFHSLRHRRQHPLGGYVAGGAVHHPRQAKRAGARAAALGLDEEHARKLRVTRDNLRVYRQLLHRRGSPMRLALVTIRQKDSRRSLHQVEEGRLTLRLPVRLGHPGHGLLAVANQNDVGKRSQRPGVGAGERAADHHQRVGLVTP